MNESKYQQYPNIYRVAQELARCKHPDKVFNTMRSLLEGSIENSANSSEDFGLKVCDVLALSDSSY